MTDSVSSILDQAFATNDIEMRHALLRSFDVHCCDNAQDLNRAGVLFYQSGRVKEAKEAFEKAVLLNPQLDRALINLGACQNELNDQQAAIRCYERVLSIDNNSIDAWSNMGKAYNDCQEFEMAVFCFTRADRLSRQTKDQKRLVTALLGLSRAYHLSGRDSRALKILNEAAQLQPENINVHNSLAGINFYLEDFATALAEFEWRLKLPYMKVYRQKHQEIFAKPSFRGEDLSSKTLLLYTEQGFGDSIQFARFIALLRPRVGRLAMYCRKGLKELFSHSLDLDDISDDCSKLPNFDLTLPLLSIPHYFDPDFNYLDNTAAYITPPQNKKFDCTPSKINVGLVWSADKSGFDHRNKIVPLESLIPFFKIPGISWHSLQMGDEAQDIKRLKLTHLLNDLSEEISHFGDTADAVQALDLVITTDTSVAHLAGAMGKPVWVMLKKSPDWRWYSDGATTRWYPSARLFRQENHGCWDSVIRRIQQSLSDLKKGPE